MDAQIQYDILFEATLPSKDTEEKEEICIIVNIEAQNKSNLPYSLLHRAIYYCSRLLDRQKNTIGGFQKSNFNDMKKVYSIWLCFHHPAKMDHVINKYTIQESCCLQEYHAKKEEYDLLEIVMVYPAKYYDYNDDDHGFLELLHLLFLSNLSAEQKKFQLQHNYQIEMTRTMGEEVELMCNLSHGIKEEGILEGRAEEKLASAILHVKGIMKKFPHMKMQEAMDILNIDPNIQAMVSKALNSEK